MKIRVLISAPYMMGVISEVRGVFEKKGVDVVVAKVKERLSEEELIPIIGDVDAIICGDDRITDRVLKSASRLKLIYKWGTGIDSIDLGACKNYGIKVKNTLDAFTNPVADTVMGYMLSFARRLQEMNDDMRSGNWQKVIGRSLSECALGVIGVGNIGMAVIKRAIPFGMKIYGNDIKKVNNPLLENNGVEMVSLPVLLGESDFISINCDLNPTSYHLISKDKISIMKDGAVVINTARGPIIDEKVLIDALASGKLGGAALDVYEEEPLSKDNPLRKMDNVMLSPHNSNSSPRAWDRVNRLTVEGVINELLEV